MKYLFIILLVFYFNRSEAQDTTYKNDLGFIFFTVAVDYFSEASPHLTQGLEYKRHFKNFNLKSSVIYYGYGEDEDRGSPPYSCRKEGIVAFGIEHAFFKGKFQLTQGFDVFERLYQVDYKDEIMLTTYSGVAFTGGFVYRYHPRLSICFELDVQLYVPNDFVDFNNDFSSRISPVRLLSLNYAFN